MSSAAVAAVRPGFARLALRRRCNAEQRAIRLLRGGDTGDADGPPVHVEQFGRLRALAARNDLVVQAPDTPWLNMDELRFLGWLAQAQRVAGYTRQFHTDAILTLTIVHCAGTLDALGIHLPSLTLCNAPVRSASG